MVVVKNIWNDRRWIMAVLAAAWEAIRTLAFSAREAEVCLHRNLVPSDSQIM